MDTIQKIGVADSSGVINILGIDPGTSGAWAILGEGGQVLEVGSFADRKRLELANIDFAILEKVSARPGQGVCSVFTFGVSYGIWQGMLENYKIPFELVTPQKWQKTVLDFVPAHTPPLKNETPTEATKRTKANRSALKAGIVAFIGRRYPDLRGFFSKKKNWDVADAICIALYGLKIWNAEHARSAGKG
jgi:hypothetical protein